MPEKHSVSSMMAAMNLIIHMHAYRYPYQPSLHFHGTAGLYTISIKKDVTYSRFGKKTIFLIINFSTRIFSLMLDYSHFDFALYGRVIVLF